MDWKERLKGEAEVLTKRIDRLEAYLNGKPDCAEHERELLSEQLYHMKEYLRLLNERLKLNGIKD